MNDRPNAFNRMLFWTQGSDFSGWQLIRTYLYIIAIIGVPYMILAGFDGFPNTFHFGEASIFMCGAVFAMLGETAIEQVEQIINARRSHKKINWEDRASSWAAIGFMALVLIAWNFTYALKPKLGPIDQLDNGAIVAFVVAAFFLPGARYLHEMYGKPDGLSDRTADA